MSLAALIALKERKKERKKGKKFKWRLWPGWNHTRPSFPIAGANHNKLAGKLTAIRKQLSPGQLQANWFS